MGSSPPIGPERRPSQGTSEAATGQDEADGASSQATRQKVRKFWDSIYHLLMRNRYLLAFIAMVVCPHIISLTTLCDAQILPVFQPDFKNSYINNNK